MKQECIPVGCIPSTAVAAGAVGGWGTCMPVSQHALGEGVCVSQHALTAHDQLECRKPKSQYPHLERSPTG